MTNLNQPFYSDEACEKILLVGDINKAFLDADTVAKDLCEVSVTLPDAVNAAAKNNFKVIGVVMSGLSARISSVLKALRESNSKAKIILLAQMYEEPIARQFVSPASNGINVADDYLICPILFRDLGSGIWDRIALFPDPRRLTPDRWSNLEQRIKELEKLATTDDLTGLKNRRYMWEFCSQIIKHAEKENGRVTLLVFDIDDFKHYNDVYGHSIGDKILKQASVLMQRCCRAHDVVGRIGGDEFAAVFWDVPPSPMDQRPGNSGQESGNRAIRSPTPDHRSLKHDHPKEVIFIAKRFIKELEKAEFAAGGLGPKGQGILTISGGLAGFPRDGLDVQELFQKADSALLEAKRSGKNRIYLVGQQQNDIADIE